MQTNTGFQPFEFIGNQRMGITLGFEQKRVVPKPVNNSSLLPSLKTRAYRNLFSISFSWFRVFSFQFDIPFILSKVQNQSQRSNFLQSSFRFLFLLFCNRAIMFAKLNPVSFPIKATTKERGRKALTHEERQT